MADTSTSSISTFMSLVPGIGLDIVDCDNVIGANGDFNTIVGINVILKSILNLVMIGPRTYPTLGVGIYDYLFEPADSQTQTKLENAIKSQLRLYETRAKIDVNITFYSNYRGFNVNLTITYIGKTQTVSIPITPELLKSVNANSNSFSSRNTA